MSTVYSKIFKLNLSFILIYFKAYKNYWSLPKGKISSGIFFSLGKFAYISSTNYASSISSISLCYLLSDGFIKIPSESTITYTLL